jgi:hypothetical protein
VLEKDLILVRARLGGDGDERGGETTDAVLSRSLQSSGKKKTRTFANNPLKVSSLSPIGPFSI